MLRNDISLRGYNDSSTFTLTNRFGGVAISQNIYNSQTTKRATNLICLIAFCTIFRSHTPTGRMCCHF